MDNEIVVPFSQESVEHWQTENGKDTYTNIQRKPTKIGQN